MRGFKRAIAGIVAMAALLAAGNAMAEDVTVRIRNNTSGTVHVEFFAQSRSAAWPGNGKVWVQSDNGFHEYALSCRSGEKICYGAGYSDDYDTYWGRSMSGREGCDHCCFYCDGGTVSYNLNPLYE